MLSKRMKGQKIRKITDHMKMKKIKIKEEIILKNRINEVVMIEKVLRWFTKKKEQQMLKEMVKILEEV